MESEGDCPAGLEATEDCSRGDIRLFVAGVALPQDHPPCAIHAIIGPRLKELAGDAGFAGHRSCVLAGLGMRCIHRIDRDAALLQNVLVGIHHTSVASRVMVFTPQPCNPSLNDADLLWNKSGVCVRSLGITCR